MMTCSARIPSAIGNGSAILFRHLTRSVQQRLFERHATEEGVDPVQNRSERRFAQAPDPATISDTDRIALIEETSEKEASY